MGQPERVIDRDDPDLLAVRADKPYFGNPDALVDTGFGADVTSLGLISSGPLYPGDLLNHPCRAIPIGG